MIWVRSSQSATSQATSNQPKNEISGKMLQENQAELAAQNNGNINPLQAEVNKNSEKNDIKASRPADRNSGTKTESQKVAEAYITVKETVGNKIYSLELDELKKPSDLKGGTLKERYHIPESYNKLLQKITFIDYDAELKNAAFEHYGVVDADGNKVNMTWDEYQKNKRSMPLYLATAHGQQTPLLQAAVPVSGDNVSPVEKNATAENENSEKNDAKVRSGTVMLRAISLQQ